MIKYNKIVNCTLKDENIVYENQFVLMQIEHFTDFNVDLTGDLFFNTGFEITNIKSETYINSLDELYKYCEKNNIKIPSQYITENGFICGGEKDFIIKHNLEGNWISE